MPANTNTANAVSLMAQLASKLGVDPNKLYSAFANVCFSVGGKAPSQEEMLSLLVVANTYDLNPFTREIFAFRGKGGSIQPIISIDGWLRILNRQKDYDGSTVTFSDKIIAIGSVAIPEWCEVTIFRKSLSNPVVVREYAQETYMPTPVWAKYPRRMLRHKTLIQGIRVAFGISGALDEDSVKEADAMSASQQASSSRVSIPAPKAQETAILPLSAPQQSQIQRLIEKVIQNPAFEKNAVAWISDRVPLDYQPAYRKALTEGLAQAASAADAVEAEIAETVEAEAAEAETAEPEVVQETLNLETDEADPADFDQP
jgi:phage recombination protein Bet